MSLGNNQREVIDYYDSHSPVMNDITLRLLMIICVLKNLHFWKLDIEDAFLEGTLDETVFVKLPYGIEYVDSKLKNKVGKLNKSIYGLKQASRQFFKELINYMQENMGLVRILIDPCLLSNLDKSFYLGVYVDDIF